MRKIVLFFLVFIAVKSFGQNLDSVKSKSILKKSMVPASLIIVGSVISNSDFEKSLQTNLRNKVGNNYEYKIDNYILVAPIVQMYLADIAGVKSKNHWFDQTKNLFISNLISSAITNRLKPIVGKTRPNGEKHSFPSGHTTIAFTNAAVLYHEFKDSSPVLAYSGFAFAAATGSFRMFNNKHYISDVMVGAGIGMLITELVYYIEPLKNFNPFKKSKNISLFPQIKEETYGFYLVYNF